MSSQDNKIISYALFGNSPKYISGALKNAQELREKLPDWTPVFYCGQSIGEALRAELSRNGAVVMPVDGREDFSGTLWRYRVFEDFPVCKLFLSRDVDSLISDSELPCVRDWIDSGRDFHVIRGDKDHFWHITAGLSGFRRSVSVEYALKRVTHQNLGSYYGVDADILYLEIWKNKSLSRLVHDFNLDRKLLGSAKNLTGDFPGRVVFDIEGRLIPFEPIDSFRGNLRVFRITSNWLKRLLERARLSKMLGKIV